MRQAHGTTTFIGFEANNNSIFLSHHGPNLVRGYHGPALTFNVSHNLHIWVPENFLSLIIQEKQK